MLSYSIVSNRLIAISLEKAHHMPADRPWNKLCQRLKRSNWRDTAHHIFANLPVELNNRTEYAKLSTPWLLPVNIWEAKWNIGDRGYVSVCNEVLSIIREQNAEMVIYTDGSATDGVKNGGAAAVLTRGDPAAPEVTHIISCRSIRFTSSLQEEREGVKTALEWLSVPADFCFCFWVQARPLPSLPLPFPSPSFPPPFFPILSL